MGKVSVFKFNINNPNAQNIINTVLSNYLNTRGFSFNSKENCYVRGNPDEKEANSNIASAIVGASSSSTAGYLNSFPCMKTEIISNQLVLTAYILNSFSGMKSYIQPGINTVYAGKEFYKDLEQNVFAPLNQNGITLASSEKVKVNDGGTKKLLKKLMLILLPIIVIFTIIIIIVANSSN